MRKTLVALTLMTVSIFGAVNIDSGKANISIIKDRANVLNFPFLIDDAKIATEDEGNYEIKAKRNSLVIIPTGAKNDRADLIVWSADQNTFVISLKNNGKQQVFDFTYNGEASFKNAKTASYETGKIDADIKKIIKAVKLKNNISGYSKVKIKRQFKTKTMLMQKDYIYNGSKYRVEEWYIKNRTPKKLFLDEATFYTKGIIAIDFEQREVKPRETIKMILIINKASLTSKE